MDTNISSKMLLLMSQNWIEKPWGHYVDLKRDENEVVKIFVVKAGERLSWQSHENREEIWVCMNGFGTIRRADNPDEPSLYHTINTKDCIQIKTGELHQLIADKGEDVIILEFQTGLPSENDIIRYEDPYKDKR